MQQATPFQRWRERARREPATAAEQRPSIKIVSRTPNEPMSLGPRRHRGRGRPSGRGCVFCVSARSRWGMRLLGANDRDSDEQTRKHAQ